MSTDIPRQATSAIFPFSIPLSDLWKSSGEFILARALPFFFAPDDYEMFKISMVETRSQRRLVLEGRLVPPWTAEVETAWRSAAEQPDGRKLVIDLTNVTCIGRDGENTLLELMRAGARFSRGDVLIRHVLRQLARRCRGTPASHSRGD